MNEQSKSWLNWFDTTLPDQSSQAALLEALSQSGRIVGNGESAGAPITQAPKTSGGIEILSAPLQDFMYDSCPPFVDIHNLIGVYNKLAFKKNLLVKGPKGDGKTLSFQHYCHTTQTPLVTVECSSGTRKKDLIGGFPTLNKFQLGPIPQAISVANEYGRCVLVFEEINSLTPQIQKVLNALLDFRRFVTIPQIGRTYRLNKGAMLWCVATMNPSVYGGTYDLNEDLRSRWIELEVGYPEHGQEKRILKEYFPNMHPDTEKLIDQCIRFAADTRQQSTGYALSTRDLVDLVGLLEVMTPQEALQLTVCKFEGDDRQTVIKRVSSSFAGIKPKKYWGSSK